MKRSKKKASRQKNQKRKSNRRQTKQNRSLGYDTLEARQMLTAVTGEIAQVGANQGINGVDSLVPNAEGDVSVNHYVEIGQQTFTVYNRSGGILESSTLDQFFLDAGADLRGESLDAPRIVFDRATERWFVVATGNGNGDFAGNQIHIAFSDTADPSGQWQSFAFPGDNSGQLVHTFATLGVDSDGVYIATQNFSQTSDGSGGLQLDELQDVSIFSLPKADLLKPNPTNARLTRFDNLSITEYGERIQFASNFDDSDGTVYGFSTQTIDLNAGSDNLPPVFQLNPAVLNSFQITDATGNDAQLSDPIFLQVADPAVLTEPIDIRQPVGDADNDGVFDDNDGDGIADFVTLEVQHGLGASLVEVNGEIVGAQTVGFGFIEGAQDIRSNGVHWFQFAVGGGDAPVLTSTGLRGADNIVFEDPTFLGDNLPDVPDMDPMVNTFETGAISYFNPSTAVSESGLVLLTYNAVSEFDAVNFGVTQPDEVFRVSVFAQFGIRVNGAQTGLDAQGNPEFDRGAIQFDEDLTQLIDSTATAVFNQGPEEPQTVWAGYSSLRADPAEPNGFFSVIPYQEIQEDDSWAVALTQILPADLEPLVEATEFADDIIVRVDGNDSDFVEIEINGVVTDRFESSIVNQITIFGHSSADTFVIDHVNGDPTPVGGFNLHGGDGVDTLESRSNEQTTFELNSVNFDNSDFYVTPDLLPFIGDPFGTDFASLADGGGQDGGLTLTTEGNEDLPAEEQVTNTFVDFEGVIGGSNDDTFLFVNGSLIGDAVGQDGNDRFVFLNDVGTNGSVNGGTGFNTLDLQQRTAGTEIQLFSVGANAGFNGRTLEGPVGQDGDILDQFRDISLIRGSTNLNVTDSLQALNQFEATITLVGSNIDPNDVASPDDADEFIASTYEANGRTLYFTEFDTVRGSVLDDVFNVQSNRIDELPNVLLDGRAGDDTFNFSSDSATNEGVLAPIDGIFEVNGGVGNNSLIVSDFGRLGAEEFLVRSARISSSSATNPANNPPIEIIYFAEDEDTMVEGTFDVVLLGSDGAVGDSFILQTFLVSNTLNVFGNGGDDTFLIQDLSQAEVNVFGGAGDDTYIIEQVSGIDNRDVTITDSIDAENDRAIIAGTILDEVFIVELDSFESDQFEFIGVEEFGFDGRGGDDQFYVRAISEEFPIVLLGGDGDDIFHISSDAPTNLGDLSTIDNDLTVDGGTGVNRILISNESGGPLDVEVADDTITGLFDNGTLNYTSTGGVFDNADGGIVIIGSNGGDDSFQITSFLAQHSLRIDGRLGEDSFTIGSDTEGSVIAGEVVVDGASDGDTYTVFIGDLAGPNVIIQDSGFSGSDLFEVIGTEGIDNIDLSEFGVAADGGTVAIGDFIEELTIDGRGSNDTITVANAPADFVTILGGGGNDIITVNGSVGVVTLDLLGGEGDDLISLNETSQLTDTTAQGGLGDDVFDVSANVLGNLVADGQEGSDQYFVDYVGTGSRTVNIVDSGVDGIDTAALFGTAGNNVFDINNNVVGAGSEAVVFNETIESLSVSGRGGDDAFNVTEAALDLVLDGQDGNDIFNLSSDAPSQTGETSAITGDLTIQGGDGLNRLRITNLSGTPSEVVITGSQITGLTGGVVNYFSNDGQFARPDGEIGGIEIRGSNQTEAGDRFDIVSLAEGDTIRIFGLGGDDVFDIGSATAGDVFVNGGDGSDTYNFQFGSTFDRAVVIEDDGSIGTDSLNLAGSNNDDVISIFTTGISDGNSLLSFNIPLEEIDIMALDGNDTFIVAGAFTSTVRLHGNAGNDQFTVNATTGVDNLDLFGGIGNDAFQFNGSSDPTRIDAFGWEGNDTFTVSDGAFGRLFLNGQNGSDTYVVAFAGEGDRRIDTRDSGTIGTDTTTVFGTGQDDRIAVRTARFIYDDEVVIFDQNTEQVTVNAGAGNDRIIVFGSRSPLTEVFAGQGDDVIVVNSTARTDVVNLSGNEGNDTFNVFRTTVNTTTNLFGNDGNDRFNIGSTVSNDNGNLGLIRGNLNIFGGTNTANGEDQLFANDNGVDAAYSYNLTPTRIDAIAGPANLPRDNFAGIGFNSSIEFVRLDGTPQVNQFRVIASQTTRFFVDGNSPNGNVADRLNIVFEQNDGRQLFFTNPQESNGFVSFANGNETVQFESIESPTLNAPATGSGSSGFSLPSGVDFSSLVDDFFSTADLEDLEDIEFGIA